MQAQAQVGGGASGNRAHHRLPWYPAPRYVGMRPQAGARQRHAARVLLRATMRRLRLWRGRRRMASPLRNADHGRTTPAAAADRRRTGGGAVCRQPQRRSTAIAAVGDALAAQRGAQSGRQRLGPELRRGAAGGEGDAGWPRVYQREMQGLDGAFQLDGLPPRQRRRPRVVVRPWLPPSLLPRAVAPLVVVQRGGVQRRWARGTAAAGLLRAQVRRSRGGGAVRQQRGGGIAEIHGPQIEGGHVGHEVVRRQSAESRSLTRTTSPGPHSPRRDSGEVCFHSCIWMCATKKMALLMLRAQLLRGEATSGTAGPQAGCQHKACTDPQVSKPPDMNNSLPDIGTDRSEHAGTAISPWLQRASAGPREGDQRAHKRLLRQLLGWQIVDCSIEPFHRTMIGRRNRIG